MSYYYAQPQPVRIVREHNGMSIAGMVLGIVSVAGGLLFFPITVLTLGIIPLIISLVGVPLSAIGYKRSQFTGVGKGQGITGIVLNWIVVGPWLVLMSMALLGAMLPGSN